MASDSAERERLRENARATFQAAKDAFDKQPQIGTPEWDEWQRLFLLAVAANHAYIHDADDRSLR